MDEVEVRRCLNAVHAASDPGDFKIAWENASQYFTTTANFAEDKVMLSSILLSADIGILKILVESLSKHGKTAFKERGLVLKFVAEKLIPDPDFQCTWHAPVILRQCLTLFHREEQGSAKMVALQPLLAFLQLESAAQLQELAQLELEDWAKAMQRNYQTNKKLTAGLKGELLQGLGDMLTLFPKLFHIGGQVNAVWLLEECTHVLQKMQGNPRAAGYTGALAGLVAALPFCQDGTVAAETELAYTSIKSSISPSVVEELKRYAGLRRALQLITSSGHLFRHFLLQDAILLLDYLSVLRCKHQNKDVRNDADAAMTNFFQLVCDELMQVPNSQLYVHKRTFQHFLGTCKCVTADPKSNSRELMVGIRAIGTLAKPAIRYFGEQTVKDLMRSISPLVERGNLPLLEKQSDLEGAAVEVETSLLSTLASLLESLPSLQDTSLHLCLQVAQRVVGAYLQLWPKQQPPVLKALLKLLHSVRSKGAALAALSQQLAVLLLTHTLKELDKDTSSLLAGPLAVDPEVAQESPAWKVYMTMWRALLMGSPTYLPAEFVAEMQGNKQEWDEVMVCMYDELMKVVIDALNNLDIKYFSLGAANSATGAAGQEEGGNMARPSEADASDLRSIRAHNMDDMRVFLRLSAFTCAFLEECGPNRFRCWAAILTVPLVTNSRNYPLLSGFYRMITVTMKLCAAAGLFSKAQTDDMYAVLVTSVHREFLADVLAACRQYKEELQASCLELLLSAPPDIVRVEDLGGPFRQAFELGRQYPPVAEVAVAALETWEKERPEQLRCIVPTILPALEPYLGDLSAQTAATAAALDTGPDRPTTAAEADTEVAGMELEAEATAQDQRLAYSRAQQARKKALRRKVVAYKQGLESLQPRIQLWLGRMGSVAHLLATLEPIGQEEANTALANKAAVKATRALQAVWDIKPRLELKLTFPGGAGDRGVWLDTVLPRIAVLAESSATRVVSVAACEFLHAITLWMVGTNAKRELSLESENYAVHPTRFHHLFARLFPVLLRLAASSEVVAQQLFEELVMGLVHWFVRSASREAAETIALLEAIMEGLSNPDNGALRHLCACATREFLKWSVKHIPASVPAGSTNNFNAASLLRRLFERLSHPQAPQRLGAAMALHLCAPVLGSEAALASDFLLECLHQCVLALKLSEGDTVGHGTQQQVRRTIDSLVHHALYKNAEALREENTETRHGFPSLAAMLQWLWSQTQLPQHLTRTKCMLLHQTLSALLLAEPLEPLDKEHARQASGVWLQREHSQDPDQLWQMCNQALLVPAPQDASEMTSKQLCDWLQRLEAAVHWASWALQQGLIQVEDMGRVDTSLDEGKVSLLEGVHQFLAALPDVTLIPAAELEQYVPPEFAGCEADSRRLGVSIARLLAEVVSSNLVDWGSAAVVNFAAAAVIAPSILSFRASEYEERKSLHRSVAKLVQQAVVHQTALVAGLQQLLGEWLQREVQGVSQGGEWGTDLMRSTAFIHGLSELRVLLPGEVFPTGISQYLPEQCLALALQLPSGDTASPQHQAAAKVALELAINLGLPQSQLLSQLLDGPAGGVLYQHFQPTLQRWLLFHAQQVLPLIVQAVIGEGLEAAHLAEQLLLGVCQALIRAVQANRGRPDLHQASFILALKQELPSICRLTSMQLPGSEFDAQSKSRFVRLLKGALAVDPAGLMSGSTPHLALLLQSYYSVLSTPMTTTAGKDIAVSQLHTAALQLLPSFLAHLPATHLRGMMQQLEAFTSTFPTNSTKLHKYSQEAITLAEQLFAIVDTLVQVSQQKHIDATKGMLQLLLPTLQEMGGPPPGHLYQRSLVPRMEAVAAAPWTAGLAKPVAAGSTSDELADGVASWCWEVLFQSPVYSLQLRKAVLKYVLQPLLDYAPEHYVLQFFKQRAVTLISIVKSGLSGPMPALASEQLRLGVRLCGYTLVHCMYANLSRELLDVALEDVEGRNTVVLKQAVGDMRELQPTDDSCRDLARDVRCAAYAAAAALLAATQHSPKVFAIAFQAKSKGGTADLWAGLLDTSLELKFGEDKGGQGRKGAREQLHHVVKRMKAERAAAVGSLGTLGGTIDSSLVSLSARVTASQYELTSQTVEEAAAGGASQTSTDPVQSGSLQPGSGAEGGNDKGWGDAFSLMDLQLPTRRGDSLDSEDDKLDTHPGMLPLVLLIEKASSLKSEVPGMPTWLQLLLDALSSAIAPRYVRFFLLKAIIHVEHRHASNVAVSSTDDMPQSMFGEYALQFFPTIVQLVCDQEPSERDKAVGNFHYLLRDVALLFLRWKKLFMGAIGDVQEDAQTFLHTMVYVSADSDPGVRQTNLEYVRAFMCQWGPAAVLTGDEILYHLKPEAAHLKETLSKPAVAGHVMIGLRTLNFALAFGQTRALFRGNNSRGAAIWRLLKELLSPEQLTSLMAVEIGRTVGLLLHFLHKLDDADAPQAKLRISQVEDDTRDILRRLHSRGNNSSLLNFLERASAHYTCLVDRAKSWLLDVVLKVHGKFRVFALEILRRRVNALEGLFEDMTRPELLSGCLHCSQQPDVQAKMLQLLEELLSVQEDFSNNLLKDVLRALPGLFLLHPVVKCRKYLFSILKLTWHQWPESRQDVRVPLLVLLADPDPELRDRVIHFWDTVLPRALGSRMLALLQLVGQGSGLSPEYQEIICKRWPAATAALLLRLTAAQPNYETDMFESSLAECQYQDYAIETLQAPSIGLIPLFSDSQQLGRDGMEEDDEGGGMGSSQSSQARPTAGMVRATQAAHLTPTIRLSLSAEARQSLSTLDAHTTQGLSQDNAALRRRSDTTNGSIIFILARKKALAEERSQMASRNRVMLMRKYRKGELPDIRSVTRSGIIGPLCQIADRDATTAGLVVSTLVDTLLGEGEDGVRAFGIELAELRKAVGSCFQLHPRDPALVQCLHAVATKDRACWVEPANVAATAQAANTLQSGVLQLEQQLLFGHPAGAAEGPPAKRARIATQAGKRGVSPVGPSVVTDQAAWAKLAGLYSQLRETALAHAVRKQRVLQCPGSLQAMEAMHQGRHELGRQLLDKCVRAEQAAADLQAKGVPAASMLPDALVQLLGPGASGVAKEEVDTWYEDLEQCARALGDWGALRNQVCEDLLADGPDADDAHDMEEADPLLAVKQQHLPRLLGQPAAGMPPATRKLHPFLQALLFSSTEDEMAKAVLEQLLQLALGDKSHMAVLKREAGLELALLHTRDCAWGQCRSAITGALGLFRSNWAARHPSATLPRHEALSMLQPLAELDEVLREAQLQHEAPHADQSGLQVMHSMTIRWGKRWPGIEYVSASAVMTLLNSRLILLEVVKRSRLAGPSGELPLGLLSEVRQQRAGLFLSAATVLKQQGFLDAAEAMLELYRDNASGTDALSGEPLLCFKRECMAVKAAQLSSSLGSQKDFRKLYELTKEVSALQQAGSTQQLHQTWLADAYSALGRCLSARQADFVSKAVQGYWKAASGDWVCGFAASSSSSSSNSSGGGSVEGMARASLQLAKMCNEMLQAEGTSAGLVPQITVSMLEPQLQKRLQGVGGLAAVVVERLLAAMSSGGEAGNQARLLVPLLLAVMGGSSAACEAFRQGWSSVPLAALLPWAGQMLSRLDAAEGSFLLPMLEKLARTYPAHMYFPFRLSSRHYSQAGRELSSALDSLLHSPELAAFQEALDSLTPPLMRWKGFELLIKRELEAGHPEEAAHIYREEAVPNLLTKPLEGTVGRGRQHAATVNYKFAKAGARAFNLAFGAEGQQLLHMTSSQVSDATNKLTAQLAGISNSATGSCELSLFSSWFAAFNDVAGAPGSRPLLLPLSSSGAFVPGEQPGLVVAGFGKTVHVFQSKQRPKKLTIYGSDFTTHEVMVKGGEDLRMDERVQTLFSVMNGVLRHDPLCAPQRLHVRTFQVLPMSSQLGLMEFVKGTKPLEHVITSAHLIPKHVEQADVAYDTYTRPYTGPDKNYNQLFTKVGRVEATRQLHAVQAMVPWDGLREALLRAAGWAEVFLVNRNHFITSLAATSIQGYLAGVGDRHAQNFLLEEATANLVPIDFGYSFGTATQMLPVPELMPFRLTHQLTSVLQPHDALQCLAKPMTEAMQALTSNDARQMLSSILTVFLREPLLDWQKEAALLKNLKLAQQGLTSDAHIQVKVEHANRKLRGEHPSSITLDELRTRHEGKPHWNKLVDIVKGDPAVNYRATVTTCNSTAEQVQCLLDQATDPNILGHTWLGWKPWL